MAFSPAAFAALAKDICNAGFDKDARVRTSISRAYYALFLEVRAAIRRAEGRSVTGARDHVDHGKLATVLYSSGEPALEAIAKDLERLYALRRSADYVLDPQPAHKSICESPQSARLIAKQVEAHLRRIPSLDWTATKGKI